MDQKHLEEIRAVAETFTANCFAKTREGCGPVALPSLAQGMLDALSVELVREFGAERAFDIFMKRADLILEDEAVAKRYVSAIAFDIETAVKKGKP